MAVFVPVSPDQIGYCLAPPPNECIGPCMAIMSVDEILAEGTRRNLRLALVVTALDLELQAVIAHLTPLASVKGRDGVIYECGLFHDVGQDWLVIVAETGAGTHQAQAVVTNAHMQFEPELQIFVGVGGSRKLDVPIGSVVAADHVYMPYGGKYIEGGFSGLAEGVRGTPSAAQRRPKGAS